MTPVLTAPDYTLQAPQRNRFFYGKLMDVAQFEKEQSYFRSRQALINRLTLGSGVLAGLNLTPGSRAGNVSIAAGAALDGAGRLIVVPAPFEIDAHTATDASGKPAGSALTSGVMLISLAYAEGTAEPVSVMTPQCDTPGSCAASTVVESYVALVRADSAPAAAYGCQLAKVPPPPDPSLLKMLMASISGFPALPSDVSVPLGRVNLADGTVDAFSERQIVFANPMLWQVIVCLAQQQGAAQQGSLLAYASGDNQTFAAGKPLPNPLVVELVDGGGNPVAGSLVQFQPGSGTVSPATIATDKSGKAQTMWTTATTPGAQTLTAGAVGLLLSVKFTAQATKG